jgi:peptidoglycan/xylan/chitin deacetylase (PgdA/CDA1 family)
MRCAYGVVGIVVAALLAACGGPAPVRDHWMGGLHPVSGSASPHGDDGPGGGSADPGAGGPSAPGSPAASGSPSAGPPDGRIPQFGPDPQPEKVTLAAGPDATFLSRIPTDQKVAFLTIDDGWTKVPDAPALFARAHVPVTLFLTINAIRDNPGYFKQFQAAGAVIEAHTITHTELRGKSADFQRHEICGSADQLGTLYGRRPVLFRPPFGDKDETTLRVTHDCGMKAAFFWRETVDKGIVRYQTGHSVQPGDIILMHFRPAFDDDFLAALKAIHDAGLTPALLEDYIPS